MCGLDRIEAPCLHRSPARLPLCRLGLASGPSDWLATRSPERQLVKRAHTLLLGGDPSRVFLSSHLVAGAEVDSRGCLWLAGWLADGAHALRDTSRKRGTAVYRLSRACQRALPPGNLLAVGQRPADTYQYASYTCDPRICQITIIGLQSTALFNLIFDHFAAFPGYVWEPFG